MSGSPDAAWLGGWLRERIVASWYLLVPLALVIALAGGTNRLSGRAEIAFLAIVAFRLWDDVEDVEHDRLHHPTRALCRLASMKGPLLIARVGIASTMALFVFSGRMFSPLLGVVLASFGAFAARSAWPHLRVLLAHVLLLKVPALVLGLTPPGTPLIVQLGRALTLYGVVGAYELVHDKEARRAPFAFVLALFDLACLCAGPAIWLRYPLVFP